MSAARTGPMNDPRHPSTPLAAPLATLEPVRFGEFLLLRNLISDEQWLAALAEHWSSPGTARRSIGTTIVANGFLAPDIIEREARAFHDEIDVVEIDADATVPDLPVAPGRA
jgi:hypothetical protein